MMNLFLSFLLGWDSMFFFFRGWNPNFYELDNFRQIPCPRLPNTEAEEVDPKICPPKDVFPEQV